MFADTHLYYYFLGRARKLQLLDRSIIGAIIAPCTHSLFLRHASCESTPLYSKDNNDVPLEPKTTNKPISSIILSYSEKYLIIVEA